MVSKVICIIYIVYSGEKVGCHASSQTDRQTDRQKCEDRARILETELVKGATCVYTCSDERYSIVLKWIYLLNKLKDFLLNEQHFELNETLCQKKEYFFNNYFAKTIWMNDSINQKSKLTNWMNQKSELEQNAPIQIATERINCNRFETVCLLQKLIEDIKLK